MVQMIANTNSCKAWQNKNGNTTITLEITRRGITLDTYTQPAQGYYTRKTEQLAAGNASILGVLVVFTAYKNDTLIDTVVDYLAQSKNLNASDTVADLFLARLFD